ncbi:MAG: hypothetical protein NC115_07290 [Bacteroidales bacterium]|nr:hypothetical protein [Bacteroidales bacterium]
MNCFHSNIVRLCWPFLAVAASCLLLTSCYKDGTDHISGDVRISLYPEIQGFEADGTTLDGAETYSAVVIVNRGASMDKGRWTAEILESPSWTNLKEVTLSSTYPDTWGTTGLHEYMEKGIEIALEPNPGAGRSFTLRVTASSGEFRDFTVSQSSGK